MVLNWELRREPVASTELCAQQRAPIARMRELKLSEQVSDECDANTLDGDARVDAGDGVGILATKVKRERVKSQAREWAEHGTFDGANRPPADGAEQGGPGSKGKGNGRGGGRGKS